MVYQSSGWVTLSGSSLGVAAPGIAVAGAVFAGSAGRDPLPARLVPGSAGTRLGW